MKCVVLGDSISEGIGKKKINYVNDLQKETNYEFINLAKTGTTIVYANNLINEIINYGPDIAIIMYGSVDAQIRPNIDKNKYNIKKFIPNRYLQKGMLDERAFYSKKIYRIIPDKIDNFIRKILKKIVVLTQGTIQLVPINQFTNIYTNFIKTLKKKNIKPILISTVFIDDKYFLNSSIEYEKYNNVIKKIAAKEKCIFIDLYNELKNSKEIHGWDMYFSKDHFHPNERGYKFIADNISKKCKEVKGETT